MTSGPSAPAPFAVLAELPVDPARALIHVEGWQSWSVTDTLPVTAAPYRPTSANDLALDSHYAQAQPEGVFQSEGVLAVDPGDGGPVQVFGVADAAEAERHVPRIRARLRADGVLEISSDAEAVGTQVHRRGAAAGEGLQQALAAWAAGFAAFAPAPAPASRPAPTVWCSWYQYWHEVTAGDVLDDLDAMAKLDLRHDVIQLDDGYQAGVGDWLDWTGRFGDLPGLIRRIRESGHRAGIWTAPLLLGRGSRILAEHPDWAVTDPRTGEPVSAGHAVRDECTALDITHPGAAAYLAEVFGTLRALGIDYFKIDFIYAGAIEGRRHEPGTTGVQAYRAALRAVREAIGPESWLLGCGAPQLPSVGLVDGMRVGPDIAATWDAPDGGATAPAQANATRNVRARAWQHGVFWRNDPDSLMIRPEVERREEWAATVRAETTRGALLSISDSPRALDPWALETTRELLALARGRRSGTAGAS